MVSLDVVLYQTISIFNFNHIMFKYILNVYDALAVVSDAAFSPFLVINSVKLLTGTLNTILNMD